MLIEEISQHGSFDGRDEAYQHCKYLNGLEGNDNLNYVVKVENSKYVVVLLAGFCDE